MWSLWNCPFKAEVNVLTAALVKMSPPPAAFDNTNQLWKTEGRTSRRQNVNHRRALSVWRLILISLDHQSVTFEEPNN